MRKIIVLFVASFLLMNLSFAQKFKVIEGSLKSLNSIEELNVIFEYPDDIKIGKMNQQDYIDKKVKEQEAKEEGSGEKWKEQYFADREEHYEPMFMELFDKYTGDLTVYQDDSDLAYTMIVETIFIEPGYNVGISSKKASVNYEIRFIKTGNENDILCTINMSKAPGTAHYDSGLRVGESFAKGAKELGKFLMKKAF